MADSSVRMADRTPLDLPHDRPLKRAESQRPTTQAKSSTARLGKSKTSARINQIAVATSQAGAASRVDEIPHTHPPTANVPAQDKALHRSRTAPLGALTDTSTLASGPPLQGYGYGEMIDSPEVAALCHRLDITPKDVLKIRKAFNDEDSENTNTITLSSFFYLINEEKRALTTCLLRLAGVTSSSATRITFDEFLHCVITFCTLAAAEVLQFFFQVYSDPNGERGGMTESDLVKLGQDLQVLRTAFAGNVQVATTANALASVQHWSFADFERFMKLHMVAFFPLLQIQANVRRVGGLGRAYWVAKTRQKLHVQSLLTHMQQNHGFLPPLPLRDRVYSVLLQRPTPTVQAHRLAQRLYG